MRKDSSFSSPSLSIATLNFLSKHRSEKRVGRLTSRCSLLAAAYTVYFTNILIKLNVREAVHWEECEKKKNKTEGGHSFQFQRNLRTVHLARSLQFAPGVTLCRHQLINPTGAGRKAGTEGRGDLQAQTNNCVSWKCGDVFKSKTSRISQQWSDTAVRVGNTFWAPS